MEIHLKKIVRFIKLEKVIKYKDLFNYDDRLKQDRQDEIKIQGQEQDGFFSVKFNEYGNLNLVNPNGMFFNYWNLIIMVILIYLAIYLPLTVAQEDFEQNYTQFVYINLGINIFFLIDILVNFNSAYLNDQDIMITDRYQITSNQLSSWFVIDFFSSLPISEVMFFAQGPENNNKNLGTLAKVLRLLKQWRLIKIIRMSKVLGMLKKSEVQKNIINYQGDSFSMIQKLFTSLVSLFFMCHLFVCMRISFARTAMVAQEPSWWSVQAGEDEMENGTLMIMASWQWAVQTVTTVGQGDIPSFNSTEKLFSLCTMIIGVGLFADFISSLSGQDPQDVLQESERVNKEEQMSTVKNNYSINGKSVIQMDQVLSKLKEKKLVAEWKVVNKLPPEKSQEVFKSIQKSQGGYVRFFNTISLDCFVDIYKNLTKKFQGERDFICTEGNSVDGIQIMEKGLVFAQNRFLEMQKLTQDGNQHSQINGDIIGVSNLILTQNCECSLVCKEFTEVLKVDTDAMIRIIKTHSLISRLRETAVEEQSNFNQGKMAILLILSIFQHQNVPVNNCFIREMKLHLFNQEGFLINLKDLKNDSKLEAKWWHAIIGRQQDSFIFKTVQFNLNILLRKLDNKLLKQHLNEHHQLKEELDDYYYEHIVLNCNLQQGSESTIHSNNNQLSALSDYMKLFLKESKFTTKLQAHSRDQDEKSHLHDMKVADKIQFITMKKEEGLNDHYELVRGVTLSSDKEMDDDPQSPEFTREFTDTELKLNGIEIVNEVYETSNSEDKEI